MNDAVVPSAAAKALRRFKPYPAYKNSGVEWLGEVPAHWEVRPLKHMANFINGFAFKPDEWGLEGTPIIRIENLNGGESFNYTTRELPAKYCADRGDLLFGWSGNRGTSFGPFLWWRDGKHYVNQHIFRVGDYDVDRKWLYWALRGVTFYVEKQAHGIIGMVHVTRGELGTIPFPVLPRREQAEIARGLDRETARIDALVAKKERLIALLQEQRTALITRAVTKGLDPTVPMKDSGVEWLGEIPAGWEVMAAGRLIEGIEQGWSPVAEDRQADPDEWAVIKLSAVSKGAFHEGEHKALPLGLAADRRWEIREGDFLMTRANTPELVADVCVVRGVRRGLMLCDLVYRLHWRSSHASREFVAYWFLSGIGRHQIEVDARGASQSMVKVSQGLIRAWAVVLPPIAEQHAIAAFLDRETVRIDALVAKVRDAIERLKELRTALISAAVTGKIDVREEVSG